MKTAALFELFTFRLLFQEWRHLTEVLRFKAASANFYFKTGFVTWLCGSKMNDASSPIDARSACQHYTLTSLMMTANIQLYYTNTFRGQPYGGDDRESG